jgi:O-antigen/teichoic acid export membrane protein
MRSALYLILISSAITLGIFLLYTKAANKAEIFDGSNLLLVLYVLSTAIVNLYLARCKFLYKYKLPTVVCIMQSILAPTLSLIALSLYPSSGDGRVFIRVSDGLLVTAAIAIPAFFIILFSDGAAAIFKPSFEMIKYLLRLALPLLPYYVSMLLISSADKIIIGATLPQGELGRYSLAYSLGWAIPGLVGGACQVLSPWIMRKVAAKNYEKVSRVCSAATSITGLAVLILLSLAPEVMSIAAPASYGDGLSTVYPVALGAIPILPASINASVSISKERVLPLTLTGISIGALNIALCLILIPKFGTGAGAVITFLSYLCLFLLGRTLAEKEVRAALPLWDTLFKIALCCTLGAIMFFVRELIAIRLIWAIVLGASLIFSLYNNRSLLKDT